MTCPSKLTRTLQARPAYPPQPGAVTFDLSLLTPQVFRVGFHPPQKVPQAQQRSPPPVTLEDLSWQHLYLPQG